MNRQILITTGDVNGIGLEVTAKSLSRLGPQRGCSFVLWVSNETPAAHFRWALGLLRRKFKIALQTDVAVALQDRSSQLKILLSTKAPAHWVEEAATACLNGQADALVTGPLSKPGIHAAGLKDIGHTEILQRLSKTPSAIMGFAGEHFRVVLATAHRPLETVAAALNERTLEVALQSAEHLRALLPPKERRRPITILGLNPHAGDSGVIGDFEQRVLMPFIKKAHGRGHLLNGPAVPDVAFRPDLWDQTSVYIALYHDQGLIPFKVVHGFNGVHLTLGLPMIRTAVDHGTATDIFGKKVANPASMLEAIKWANALSTKKGRFDV